MQDNSQQTVVVKPKPNRSNRTWYIAAAVVAGGIIICLAYFAGASLNAGKSQTPAAAKPQTATPQQTTAPVSTPSNPPVAQPPAQTPTPTATPTPSNPPATPAASPSQQTPTPAYNPPASSTGSGSLITKQAYLMTLTLDDMGQGWMLGNAGSPGKAQLFSSSHVTFTKGSAFSPVVQNTVEVYRTLDAAINAYDGERPANSATLSLSYPNVGDSCFLNDTVATNKTLVFRKNNVVVWIMVQQDKTSDPVHYAQIVEQKIAP